MITASLVLYNSPEEQIKRILDCVQKSEIDRIFVFDNSTDPKSKAICEAFSKVTFTYHENTGYGGTHNLGIKEAVQLKSDYHLVVNPDIYFEPQTITELKKFMDDNPDCAQIMPKITYPDGSLQYLCKMIPSPSDLFIKRFLPGKLKQKLLYKFQLKFTGYDKIMNIPYLSGCFMFFKTEAFTKVGMFDERFFMYPEDIDITRRMHEQYKTLFYPFVTVVHDHGAASYKSKKMLMVHIKNMCKYFNKWGWLFDRKRSRTNRELLKELNWKQLKKNYKAGK